MQSPFAGNEPVKAVVFDLDGTLTDSLKEIKAACDHALWLVARREPFSLNDYALMAGSGNAILMRRVLAAAEIRARGEMAPVSQVLDSDNGGVSAEKVQQAVAAKIAYEDAAASRGESKIEAFDGAHEVLRAVAGAGVKTAVLSNKTQAAVTRTVSAVFPEAGFLAVVGARDGQPLKPAADALLRVVRALDVDPRNVVMVGDTGVDMQTARNAGTRSVGVTWGFRKAAELKENGASRIANTFDELTTILNCPVKTPIFATV